MAICIGASDFIGGTADCLDALDGNDYTVGSSFAMVFGQGTPLGYEYISTTDTENSPYLIRPDTNGTGKAWRQNSVITGNCSLYVRSTGNDSTGNGTASAPWLTLAKAIDWLNDKIIASDVTVTINLVESTTFVISAAINIVGPQFKQVKILGNGSSNTTLSWAAAGTDGLVIDRNTNLQDISSIKLLGDGTNGYGIWVYNNSSLYINADVLVDSFNYGINCNLSSSLDVASGQLSITGCNTIGLFGANIASIRVPSCTFSNNSGHGVYAANGGAILAVGATASSNGGSGFFSYKNSWIDAGSSTAASNGGSDYSPAKTTANDPTFGNYGSWIYG